jgi:hypothetical protein
LPIGTTSGAAVAGTGVKVVKRKAAAMAANDWTAYGKADDRLNAAIEQLLKLIN